MLRIHASVNSASAERYFDLSLKKADYYLDGQELEAVWHGKSLACVGLAEGDAVTDDAYKALLHNKRPQGGNLTARTNAIGERIPGWDFTFSMPKSLSIMQMIAGDNRILTAFQESVREVMAEIEKGVTARVRIGGKNEDRVVGNFAWAEFVHLTTRPLNDGIPDPHGHCHAYVVNFLEDTVERKMKAIKMRPTIKQAFFYEALHDSILAGKISKLGYSVVRTSKGWEIEGLSLELLKKFSRRTTEIEKLVAELGLTDPKEKDKIGAKTRGKKIAGQKQSDLVKEWRSRLTPDERAEIKRVLAGRNTGSAVKPTAKEALDFAMAVQFERASVVARSRILAAGLRFGVGAVSLADLEAEMKRRDFIELTVDGRAKVTTPEWSSRKPVWSRG